MAKYKHVPSGIEVEKIGMTNGVDTEWFFKTSEGYNIPDWIVQGKDWEEVKERKFLFETEEGNGLFYGDACWVIELPSYHLCGCAKMDNIKHPNQVYFLKKEFAIDYILENKPCLSFKDIIRLFPVTLTPDAQDSLSRLVKSKLAIP